jgi:hypothetical protein
MLCCLAERQRTNKTCLVAGATDDRGENSAGSIVASEAGLAHTRAVVHDKGGDLYKMQIVLFQKTV